MTSKLIYVWTSFLFLITDAQMFTSSPDSKSTKCTTDDEYNLPWIYSVSPNNAATVEWKKDGTTMLTWIVSINNYAYDTGNGYSSTKLVHNNNGNITIKTLTSSDAGVYVCEVTYASSGAIITSPGVTLEISSCSGNSNGKFGTGAIIGITIGCIAGVVVFVLIVCIRMFVVGRKRRNEMNGDEKAVDVCCCACCICCACCSSFLMCVTCHLLVNRNNTRIDPEVEEEFVYARKNTNIEFGKHIPNTTNAKWEKDRKEVGTSHRELTMFKIDGVSVNNEGLYICTIGPNELKLKYYVIVVGRTEMVYLREHQKVELGKTIPGLESIPNVKWMKDEEDVKPGDLVRNKLKIKKASPNDEGTYVCTLGTEVRQLTYHLIIVGTERTIHVIEGKQIEFGKDIPDSDATSDAYWTKDGKPVKSTSQKKTFYHIDEADENSNGLYVCHLGNKAELKYLLIKSE